MRVYTKILDFPDLIFNSPIESLIATRTTDIFVVNTRSAHKFFSLSMGQKLPLGAADFLMKNKQNEI